jgi:hypothetical protein
MGVGAGFGAFRENVEPAAIGAFHPPLFAQVEVDFRMAQGAAPAGEVEEIEQAEEIVEQRLPVAEADTGRPESVQDLVGRDDVPAAVLAADGKSVTWKLKKGVKWHDGQPFTADDVVFTWQYSAEPATAAERADEGSAPPSDSFGSEEYRRALSKVLVRRALEEALA